MATGGSPNISQSMVPSSTSTLRRSNRSKSNISLIKKSKNYELNKQKAIDKKRSDCNSPHIQYEMKPKTNFCISLSTARDRSIGNQHKYTVNYYNTTSRILVNGVKTDKFAENVLPIILELITSNETELDSVNNDIQRSIQPIEVNQWSNISPNKDNTNVTGPRITQNSIEYTQISQAEVQQNVTIYFCPICNERAGERNVGCKQCDEWIHFNCAGLKDSDIDKIRDNPFVCR
ncbi:MLL3 [Mytilus coruscus]|uniref:MLL3 n=1 Tax=Mytilus coruscus TaxID=42192 RepID=A0A6J8B2I8_MYTCO|nr:MLL3 [Mytilus coruscus]